MGLEPEERHVREGKTDVRTVSKSGCAEHCAWWHFKGDKKRGVIDNCRILNLWSEGEGTREHLEEELGRKDSSLAMNCQ